MAEMWRVFIAIELDETFKAVLSQIGDEIGRRIPAGTVRWVKPAAMHLTLVFLGDTPTGRLADLESALARAASTVGPISLSASGLGCFPNLRRPRVVWVGVDEPAGALGRLKQALDDELLALGFKLERRAYRPHLTLGRVNKRTRPAEAAALGEVVGGATLEDAARMTADQVHLIRSELRPAGPLYSMLASVPLSGE